MNSLKTVFFSILTLAPCMCNGMEPENLNEAQAYQAITFWADVEPFLGKIVAYTTCSSYLSWKDTAYKIDSQPDVSFGFIPYDAPKSFQCHSRYEDIDLYKGYEMYPLLKNNKDVYSNTCALTFHTLEKANLKMRKITDQEASEICMAVTTKKAVLDFLDDTNHPNFKQFLWLLKPYNENNE